MASWRPRTGWEIALNDRTLAKIGFLAVASEQARQISLACLKSTQALNADQWVAAQNRKFFKITEELLRLTFELDAELHRRALRLEAKRVQAEDLRHRFVHSTWGHGPEQNRQVSYDYKGNVLSTEGDLQAALDAVAHMTLLARLCLERTADLIVEGSLPNGNRGGPAMSMRWRGQLVTF